MAEPEIANTTFGIPSVHLTTGPWKQVLEPYGKQLELPSRLQVFANAKRKKDLMRLPAQGILLGSSLLQYYARNAFSDGALPFTTCVTLSLGEER